MRSGAASGNPTGSWDVQPASRGCGPLGRLSVVLLVTLWMLLADPWAAQGQSQPQPAPDRRVLLLYSEPRLIRAVVDLDATFRSTLESQSSVPVSFYTEFLDLNLFDGTVPLPALRELLRRKYEARPLDLIVAAGSRALRIAVHNRGDLFSNAPIVF